MHLSHLARTKIVCTLGPSSSTRETLSELMDAGMNVARLNFSHGEHETHAKNILLLRELSKEKNLPIAILQDLQGPKIRTGKLKNNSVTLTAGQLVTLKYGTEQLDDDLVIDYQGLALDTTVGSRILLDDGLLAMKVIGIDGANVRCEVIYGGILRSRKGVNFPDNALSIPAITEKDTRDLLFGVSQHVDYIALSFVQSAGDINQLKQVLRALGADIPVVAKIEMFTALQHLKAICEVSDAIMVARGDLGVECGFAQVSLYQKQIVEMARHVGRPVIVATQMLESMITSPVPTKAEIADVANAVFDGADATMLSGETASGSFPFAAVQMMRNIAKLVESSGTLVKVTDHPIQHEHLNEPEMIADIAVRCAIASDAKAIVCLTLTGKVARSVARYRPDIPVIAISPRPDVVRKLSLVYGVYGIQNPLFLETDVAIGHVGQILAKQGLVKLGDLIVITCGTPVKSMKPTNALKLHRINAQDFEGITTETVVPQ